MKIDPHTLETRQPRTLGPIIERIVNIHQKNQNTELKSQSANHSFVVDYSTRKLDYEKKMKVKQEQILKRVNDKKTIKVEVSKKQSQHVQHILDKFKKEDKAREQRRLQRINKRNFSNHRNNIVRNSAISGTFFNLTQQVQTPVQSRCISSSLDLDAFYNKKYSKIVQFSNEVQKKSAQKRLKVQQNIQRIKNQLYHLKEQNENKLLRKMKADESFQQKQNQMIKKSITKLELSEKRCQELESSQRKKSIQRSQKSNKNLQQIRKRRHNLQSKLSEKYLNLEKQLLQKQHKINQNKENLIESIVQHKKNKRMKKVELIQINFNKSHGQFMTKMTSMYKKDREDWGFLTSVNQFKNILIQKNVYQNNQLALLK